MTMKLWMARDLSIDGARYNFGQRKMRWNSTGGWAPDGEEVLFCMCPNIWHRLGGPRLKPGAAPVRIEVDPKLFAKAVKVVRGK